MLKIISGGQTGVDRGALDAALECHVQCGGWCPDGRKAEDKLIPKRYPIKELPGGGYHQRTRQNILDSDGTVIVYFEALSGGTEQTLRLCLDEKKPYLLLDAVEVAPIRAAARIEKFYRGLPGPTLNLAGPRSSTNEQAYDYAKEVITIFIGQFKRRSNKSLVEENEGLLKIITDRLSQGDFQVPPMPGIVEQVLQMDDDVGVVDLAKVIIQDQAITSNIIRIANSAFYRGVSKFDKLPTAISRIGISQVRILIVGFSFLSKEFMVGKYHKECRGLGEHALGCAYIASILAEITGFSSKEDAFLGGLLHDIGKLVIFTVLSEVDEDQTNTWTDETLEEALFKFHPIAGEYVASTWKLQPWLSEVIRKHHRFHEATERPQLVALVALANRFCHHFGLGVPEEKDKEILAFGLGEAAHFSLKRLPNIENRIDQIKDLIRQFGPPS
ncbi:MAG: YpsA SLOG family protein [Nitrospiria bacterium]